MFHKVSVVGYWNAKVLAFWKCFNITDYTIYNPKYVVQSLPGKKYKTQYAVTTETTFWYHLEIIWLIKMKMKTTLKNRSHRLDINRLRQRNKYTKYTKNCLTVMMPFTYICIYLDIITVRQFFVCVYILSA